MSHKATESREIRAYYDYMKKLQEKYGLPSGPYILVAKDSGKRRKNPKISRTKEGLYIHHTGELMIPALSTGIVSDAAPLAFQEPNMLAYCDLLEHLLAHIMIVEASITDRDYVVASGAGIGGMKMIVGKLNDWYAGSTPAEDNWELQAWLLVKDRRSEYRGLLKRGQRALCTLGVSGSLKKTSFEKECPRVKYTRKDSPE